MKRLMRKLIEAFFCSNLLLLISVMMNPLMTKNMSTPALPALTRDGMPDINLDDWDVDSTVAMPEDDPDITGMITDKFDTYYVSLQIRDREAQTTYTEYVHMDENTNIFLMDMESQSVSVVSIEDVQEGSLLRVWGNQNTDGSWHATDVRLMTGRPDGGRP